jgi:OOP family OmpA-OmpF porin
MAVKDPNLEALRQLLLQPEQRALQELGRPELWVNKVAEALPEAITRRSAQDRAIQHSVTPVLLEALSVLVRREPKQVAEILFPLIIPAIRRSITDTFASLVQGFNQTLDHAVSPQGLRWRFEALTTGKSFAEVVLSHTLLYRVEQVLLVHRESGLMMAHRVAEGVQTQDGGMVSAMLTAIEDFVRDSFDPQAGLDTVDFGERVLVVDQGRKAVLAAVVWGAPPPEFKRRLQDLHLEVQMSHGEQLETYEGNPQTLAAAHPLLDNLLEARYKTPAKKPPYPLIVLGLILLALLGWWGLRNYQTAQAWNTYLGRLQSTAGLVVTDAPARYTVRGLRDPLAPDPATLLEGLHLDPKRLKATWEPYRSLEPALTLKRIQQYIALPPQTALGFKGKTLVVGWAPEGVIEQLKTLAPALGIEQIEVLK